MARPSIDAECGIEWSHPATSPGPAPAPRLDRSERDLEAHAGLGATDRDRTAEGGAIVTRWDPGLELTARSGGGGGRLQPPADIERAETDRVAGLGDEGGWQLARKLPVQVRALRL